MRVAFLSIRRWFFRAALVAAGLGMMVAPAPAQGNKVEFSSPGGSTTSTNAGKSSLEQSEFQHFKEDLFRPLESLDRGNSMKGVMPFSPPPQPRQSTIPDKHTRELIERERNWAFTDMSDLYPQPSLEELLHVRQYGPDGREKTDRSAIETYYERQDQNRSADAKQSKENFEEMESQRYSSTNAVNPWDVTFPVSARFGKNSGAKGDPDKANQNLSPFEIPAVSANAISEAMENQKKRLQEFQALLEPHAAARATNSATASFVQDLFSSPSQAIRDDPFGRDQTPAGPPRRAKVDPLLGVINPTPASLDSRVYHDPTAASLGMPSLNSSKPPAAPKPPQIVDVFPQRKF